MTAMSAPRASETRSTATPPTARVRIPGSVRTYEARETLRGMGLRWDPASHAWHGMLPSSQGAQLEREFGLRPQVVRAIETFGEITLTRPSTPPIPTRPAGPRPPCAPRAIRDGSRTCAEARSAYRDVDEDPDGIATRTRRFSVQEITSGLADDSREVDEREEEQRLREVRGRVKAARALVSTTPGLAETLRADWHKAARFYARFGITEQTLREGVKKLDLSSDCDAREYQQWRLQ